MSNTNTALPGAEVAYWPLFGDELIFTLALVFLVWTGFALCWHAAWVAPAPQLTIELVRPRLRAIGRFKPDAWRLGRFSQLFVPTQVKVGALVVAVLYVVQIS